MAPSPAWTSVRALAKRGQGYVQAGLLSREINEIGVPTLLSKAEGHTAGGVMREPPVDPARSENLGMYGIFTRENREIPRSPAWVMIGRDAWGTLRRYA
jgi:hypothetical protein